MLVKATACDTCFDKLIESNQTLVSSILPLSFGGYTKEDLIPMWYVKMKESGYSDQAILSLAAIPQILRRSLLNLKNDLFRKETVAGLNQRSFRDIELEDEFSDMSEDQNPEAMLISGVKEAGIKLGVAHLFRVAGLSKTHKKILYMDMEGYSNDEIAEALHTSKATVYSRRNQAMKLLKKVAQTNESIQKQIKEV